MRVSCSAGRFESHAGGFSVRPERSRFPIVHGTRRPVREPALFRAPHKISPGRPALFPQIKAKEIPVGKTQHTWRKILYNTFRQSTFAHRVRPHTAPKQHMSPILHQRNKTYLRVSAFPPACARIPVSFSVLSRVRHIQCAAIKAYQTPTTEPRAFGIFFGNRSYDFIMKGFYRLPSQTSARLRHPRFPCHMDFFPGLLPPLKPFQQATETLTIGHL